MSTVSNACQEKTEIEEAHLLFKYPWSVSNAAQHNCLLKQAKCLMPAMLMHINIKAVTLCMATFILEILFNFPCTFILICMPRRREEIAEMREHLYKYIYLSEKEKHWNKMSYVADGRAGGSGKLWQVILEIVVD